ncbi:MAG: hypothetical protein KZQ90_09250 [Candidatus Thiodiazotropha sp. (ex Codakia rugifera)]|nr:hypothetical protein [Candidatus Thiodiazotropha sp. (ex Codakia rugifera)]
MGAERKGRTLGTWGTIIGLIAFGIGILHFTFGPINEPQPVESFVADTTVKIKEAVKAKMQGKEYTPPPSTQSLDIDDLLYKSVMVAGLIAVGLGSIGFTQKEEWRPSGVAFILGAAAITLQLSIAFVGALIVFLIIAAIISGLGIDIG